MGSRSGFMAWKIEERYSAVLEILLFMTLFLPQQSLTFNDYVSLKYTCIFLSEAVLNTYYNLFAGGVKDFPHGIGRQNLGLEDTYIV